MLVLGLHTRFIRRFFRKKLYVWNVFLFSSRLGLRDCIPADVRSTCDVCGHVFLSRRRTTDVGHSSGLYRWSLVVLQSTDRQSKNASYTWIFNERWTAQRQRHRSPQAMSSVVVLFLRDSEHRTMPSFNFRPIRWLATHVREDPAAMVTFLVYCPLVC